MKLLKLHKGKPQHLSYVEQYTVHAQNQSVKILTPSNSEQKPSLNST